MFSTVSSHFLLIKMFSPGTLKMPEGPVSLLLLRQLFHIKRRFCFGDVTAAYLFLYICTFCDNKAASETKPVACWLFILELQHVAPLLLLQSQVVLRLYSPLYFPGMTGENMETGMSDHLLACSQVKLDVLQSAKTLSLQSREACEQVLAVVVFINVNDQRPATQARLLIRPPQSQVMTMNLETQQPLSCGGQPGFYSLVSYEAQMFAVTFSYLKERAVAAVPDDALHSTLWALLEPGPQLLEVHRWRVSYWNAPM